MKYNTNYQKVDSISLLLNKEGKVIGEKFIIFDKAESTAREFRKYFNGKVSHVIEKRDGVKILYEIGKNDIIFRRTIKNSKNLITRIEIYNTNEEIIKSITRSYDKDGHIKKEHVIYPKLNKESKIIF